MAFTPPRRQPLQTGLFTPHSFPRDATATKPAPLSPRDIELARRAMYRLEMEKNATKLAPTTYTNPALRSDMAKRQAWKEGEDMILDVANKAAMLAPVPYVGEVAAPLAGAVSAGILGARALRDVKQGNLESAATNAGLGIVNGFGAGMVGKVLPNVHRMAFPTFANTAEQVAADKGSEWAKNWFRERAKAGMGGLKPSDGSAVAQIKRPVILPDAAFGAKRAEALHSPIFKQSGVTPLGVSKGPEYIERAMTHEATHDFQSVANSSTMQQAYQNVKRIMVNTKAYENGSPGFIKYANKPNEIHARISEARFELKLRPDEVITKERLIPHQQALGKRTGVTDLNVLTQLFNRLPAAAPIVGAGAGVGILRWNAAQRKPQ